MKNMSMKIFFALSLAVSAPNTVADSSFTKWLKPEKKKRERLWFDELSDARKAREKQQQHVAIQSSLNQAVREDLAQQQRVNKDIACLTQPNLNSSQKGISLMDAIERTVCRYPETRSAWVQTKIQAAQLKIAQSTYYPQLDASVNYDWGRDDYQVDGRPELSYDTNTRRYGLTIQANWLLFDFGARKYQVEEAQKLLAMSLAQQDAVLQSTILKAISAYYQIIQIELKLDNLKQLVVFAEQNYKIAHARYKAGAGIKSDELQMSANLAKAKSDQTQLQGELKIAKGQLSALMGEPAYHDFKIQNQLKIPYSLNLKKIESLIQDASEIHPKLKAAKLGIKAAEDKIKSTQKSKYPSLSMTSSMQHSRQLGESPFANETQRLQAGVQLNFPLFDGFNRKNQIVIAQQNLQLKQLEEEQLKLEISTEIWKKYNELEALQENIKALSLLDQSASKAYEVSRGRYKAGVGSMLEVVNAQNLMTESKMNYSTALTQFLVVRYELLSNIGNLNLWTKP